MRRLGLTQWILISVVAGAVAGMLFREFAPAVFDPAAGEVGPWGHGVRRAFDFSRDLFINLLKMIIVPLILTSIVSGLLSVGDGQALGRMGLKTLAYYLSTSTLAIVTGLLLINLFQPGVGADIPLQAVPEALHAADQSPLEFLFGFILGLVPTNPFRAMVEGETLQVIFFAFLVGLFILRIPEPYRGTLSRLFQGGFELMMRIVHFVFLFAPLGIFALITILIATVPDLRNLKALGLYALVVLAGLAIHACVTLPAILFLIGRVSPLRHVKAMSPALLVAFSSASSSGTLPLTMECAERRAGISNRTTSFVLPLGATVNMDGTALYECVAAVFIAQIYVSQGAIDPLTFGQQLLIVITALAASIGAAGIPMAGLVMIGIILKAIGLPLEALGYILAVDRILDMFRTSVNVWSDACGAAVIARSEGETGVLAN